ncbi:MAG: glycosyltransferase family 4 protein [candidate division KSB1 bacterium]|nr:glycosyltransferase family 4 protein [candidate division KSB1 bacterium]MDZ7273238.1 glycosyltransferase family 4 protein [candidate division KSB1 bacterium]MDZ7285340.1 glycosyltransferase family 4 protein [candidate division KSB1 bacterium]MDZ7298372.1 glycosyltransferase family 4 protein [candidate division KSB1 bacterium]MDZ7306450.1 glycosyltransferase family 4 protein [candidate division KSB1 bacterium]
MNIAYLSADFGVPIFGYKGASIHVREVTAALRRLGHTVHLFSPALEAETAGQPGLFAVPARPDHLALFKELGQLDTFLGVSTRVRHELRNLLYNFTLYEAALEHLRRLVVEVIYERYSLFAYAGIKLARTLGIPHLLEVNAPLSLEQEQSRGLDLKILARHLEQKIWNETDRLLVVSSELKQLALGLGVPAERIVVLPNGVDPARFLAVAAAGRDWPGQRNDAPLCGPAVRAQWRLADKCVIGFVGSLKSWHGTETLVQAFEDMPAHTHLLIVGDGPQREALEQLVHARHLEAQVTFTGKVPYDDIPAHIAAMDITVAPYTPSAHFYFSPIKIYEYMMMAKPVVAGAIGQVKEIVVPGQNGLLYEPGNVTALRQALLQLAGDPARRAEMGKAGQAWVQRERTWDHNAAEIVRHAQALRRPGAPSSGVTA